ncbi:LMBR1 domain protein [Trichophyton verrucosum HKI 0517]|uniref:LMBR1 domain protein n=1 Tax=Trichophyton verrucosum (strain HKI 0517) TaxID=663202 RepID=D4DI29_TRIVH|nr:LMBR1 domain protein [Trichophyton verrucosum HKI 0517]EFE38507.1 LMBR1 domain protein [Trichophyton verrucosum HKI 0517]
MLYSLRSNARYQLIVLCSGLLGLIYLALTHELHFSSLRGLVMALAYAWGLVLAIYLLGHGLVALPRKMWRAAWTGHRLRRLQQRAVRVHDALVEAGGKLEELRSLVSLLRRKRGLSLEMQERVDELVDVVAAAGQGQDVRRGGPAAVQSLQSEGRASVPHVITDRYMAGLTRDLYRARHKHARYADAWSRLVREALDCQTILDAATSKQLVFDSRSSLSPSSSGFGPLLTPYLRYLIYTHLLPAIYICLAAVFACLSVCILWSELVRTFFPFLSIVALTTPSSEPVGFPSQLLTSVWLLYLCAAAGTGISDAQVWGNRALVPRNTYHESACWYAGQVARLTVPLAYNFLTLLPTDLQLRTTFYDFLGKGINLTLIGEGFDLFFPLFILLPVAATAFNLYGKVKGLVGLGDMEIYDEDEEDNPSGFGTGGWREGRSLIETELNGPGYLGLSSTSRTPRSSTTSSRTAAHRANLPDTLPRYRDAPPPTTPSNRGTAAAASAAAAPAHTSASTSAPRPVDGEEDEEDEEDEGFFQSFAHRVRNTIDTASTPKWLQDVDAGFKRPRWMGGTNDGDAPGPSSSSPSTDSSAFARWFGGGGGSGGVRL